MIDSLSKEDLKTKYGDRDINDYDSPDEWPKNPDDWIPPEKDKAKENSSGKNRHGKMEMEI